MFPHKKVGNPMVNHQIPMGKDWKTHGKPSGSYIKIQMVNHQIPMGKDWKSKGKPSGSYIKRLEIQW